MYPRNAASPERIAIGAVILIADGTVQTSGVAVTVRGQGGAEAGSAGTIAYGASGIVYYTPTQGETDFTSFVLIASKASCIPVAVTIVTSASATAGYAGVDWGFVANKTTTNALTGTTIAVTQKVDVETIKTNAVVNGGTVTFPTNATLASTTNITAATGITLTPTTGLGAQNGPVATVTTVTNQLTAAAIATGIFRDTTASDFTLAGSVGLSIMNGVALGTGLTVNDLTTKSGFSLTAVTGLGAQTANITGNLSGSVGSISGITFPTNFGAQAITAGGLVSSNDFTTAMTESYRANGATGTPAQVLYELLGNVVEQNNSGTTRTVKKIDHSTTATTYTYDASTPNTITRAT